MSDNVRNIKTAQFGGGTGGASLSPWGPGSPSWAGGHGSRGRQHSGQDSSFGDMMDDSLDSFLGRTRRNDDRNNTKSIETHLQECCHTNSLEDDLMPYALTKDERNLIGLKKNLHKKELYNQKLDKTVDKIIDTEASPSLKRRFKIQNQGLEASLDDRHVHKPDTKYEYVYEKLQERSAMIKQAAPVINRGTTTVFDNNYEENDGPFAHSNDIQTKRYTTWPMGKKTIIDEGRNLDTAIKQMNNDNYGGAPSPGEETLLDYTEVPFNYNANPGQHLDSPIPENLKPTDELTIEQLLSLLKKHQTSQLPPQDPYSEVNTDKTMGDEPRSQMERYPSNFNIENKVPY